jgi:DNA-binding transcriptional ArsR family regulator
MKLNRDASRLDAVFMALAHPTRRRLLRRMAERGESRVTELADGFDVSLNQISKHLKILERAGLMRRRRDGREHRCAADLRTLLAARSWIDAYTTFWRESLEGLDAWLESNPDTEEAGE